VNDVVTVGRRSTVLALHLPCLNTLDLPTCCALRLPHHTHAARARGAAAEHQHGATRQWANNMKVHLKWRVIRRRNMMGAGVGGIARQHIKAKSIIDTPRHVALHTRVGSSISAAASRKKQRCAWQQTSVYTSIHYGGMKEAHAAPPALLSYSLRTLCAALTAIALPLSCTVASWLSHSYGRCTAQRHALLLLLWHITLHYTSHSHLAHNTLRLLSRARSIINA